MPPSAAGAVSPAARRARPVGAASSAPLLGSESGAEVDYSGAAVPMPQDSAPLDSPSPAPSVLPGGRPSPALDARRRLRVCPVPSVLPGGRPVWPSSPRPSASGVRRRRSCRVVGPSFAAAWRLRVPAEARPAAIRPTRCGWSKIRTAGPDGRSCCTVAVIPRAAPSARAGVSASAVQRVGRRFKFPVAGPEGSGRGAVPEVRAADQGHGLPAGWSGAERSRRATVGRPR